MKLLAVMGSPRKGKATDLLVDKAVEGALSARSVLETTKIILAEHDVRSCINCLVCRDRETDDPLSPCSIRDDMDWIYDLVLESELLVFGTPLRTMVSETTERLWTMVSETLEREWPDSGK